MARFYLPVVLLVLVEGAAGKVALVPGPPLLLLFVIVARSPTADIVGAQSIWGTCWRMVIVHPAFRCVHG